ncbi:non-ribosomal peptide synthetase [Hyphomicrobium sp. LHD-15]|uniref:non-ribosomal peptide synthetase n=1 Tax=Hyphomicrobium sp. LHD-15 TaxID=3072142 RepID=UPI00280F690D|nr:non-ribosomal peptide synthetase [Hyphomicrobium sp. LHD-15]MDQ8699141.1 amino acid adenylation domain-containing protein [Hyphomicrobium sp. LHD-15]
MVESAVAEPRDLRALFFRQCARFGAAVAYTVLADDLSVANAITFSALEGRVLSLACGLAARCQTGDRVLLALDNGLDSVELFWACIVAGLVPVPAPAPRQFADAGSRRLNGIVEDSGAALVISAAEHRDEFAHLSVPWISRDALDSAGLRLPDVAISGDDLAYLQYTSGSTSDPRGVELTHANVMCHCAELSRAVEASEAPTSSLSWLPWFHDFGLVQGVLSPVYLGITSYLMPTATFMRRPLSWLDAIGKFKISYSGAPDTGFLACVKALSRKSGWTGDLSSWSLATSGGEPVRAETVESFSRAFAPHGFRPRSLAPAYGMAEAVLALTIKPGDELPLVVVLDAAALDHNQVQDATAETSRSRRSLVGCGQLLDGVEVRVVDPEQAEECAPGTVGEIWVSGASIGRGYWGKPALSEETFGARLASQGRTGPRYLRTGDLGFVRDGQLFISGRLKDIIVVHGRNLYPHDIELTAQNAHPSIRASGVIAFGIERPEGEAVVVLAERAGHRDPDGARDLVDRIRREVSAEHGVEVHDVVLLKRGTLPHTSSGKPQRSAAKRAYLGGEYSDGSSLPKGVGELARGPNDALERIVADAWISVLNLDRADVDADFFLMGGNSLIATQLVSRLNAACGADLPVRAVFEAPTISGLAQKLRDAPGRGGAKPLLTAPVEHSGKAAGYPLSFSQERFWFVSQQVPESTAYHMPLALRFKGVLDVPALEAAFTRIIDRHEILRTTFKGTSTGVEARVHPATPFRIRCSKLEASGASARVSDEALERHLARLAQEPFDLEQGPLIRAYLAELGPDEAVLLIVMHHIIGDQWSFAVLARELAHFYRAGRGRASGEAGTLPPLALQYGDFAAWQRQTFEGDRRELEEHHWRALLEGMEPLQIASDFPRPHQQLYRGAQVRVPFDPKLISELTALGARHSASLSMVMMAALNVLMQRVTGQSDVSFGVSVAGRNQAWSEALIGTFVNVLLFRTEVDKSQDFSALLGRVRETALDAFAHQDMPFDQLVKVLKHQRDASRAPLFQVLFNMINVPVGKLDFADLDVSRVNFDARSSQFDLAVMIDAEHDFSISFEYAVQVFQRETIERFAAHYLKLLEAVVRAPQNTAVVQLSVMDSAETAKVLALGRGPDLELPVETVTDWLRPAFAKWKDEAAVLFEDESVSYRTLDRAASAVARMLRQRGIGRGHKVGLYVSRTPAMLAAQLGVLKSGAAYVPLDPINPAQRLEYIVRDAELSLILVDGEGSASRAWMERVPALDVAACMADAEFDGGSVDADAPNDLDARGDDPAYVLYTSGSTGEPKGVLVSHRSLVNLLQSVTLEPGLSSSDRVLAITTLSFDISVVETLLPLGVGASIVLAGRDDIVDGSALLRLIDAHKVSFVQATPSTWHLLLNAGWKGSPSVKKVVVTGEALPQSLAVDLVARCGEVWNMYGPTETTVWSTGGRVEDPEGRGISIGRPLANTQTYVLDTDFQLCPIGVEGDLFIGGVGVSQGYVNLPDLTAERFLPDALGPQNANARIYRTGDRARWLNDGTLAHLGRSDSQVKLRGYRIELSEIEAHLARHPQVARAAVSVREVVAGDPRLVAHVVPRGKGLTADTLRQHLSRFLPDYMLPQHISLIDALPLLASGKIDSKRLASLPLQALSSRTITAPRTSEELAVWEIWRDVLGIDDFGVHDNFFDLGGHSMLAVRVVNRVRAEFDRTCTIPMLFQHPTVADLVAGMHARADAETPLVVALQELGETPPLFCICGIHLYQDLANHLAPHRRVYALFVPSEISILNGDADHGALSVEAIAADYIKEIRKKQPNGPYYLAGLSFGGLLAFEVAQQLRRRGEEVAFLAMFDTIMPMGRLEVVAFKALHHIRRLPEVGFSRVFARGKSLISESVSAARYHRVVSVASLDAAVAEEARQMALRNEVYLRAARRYKARPYDGEAILMRAEDSKIPDTTNLWRRVINKLDVLSVPGDHLGILKSPYVSVVARHLLAKLGSDTSEERSSIG